jgi:uncharacterized membrane protein
MIKGAVFCLVCLVIISGVLSGCILFAHSVSFTEIGTSGGSNLVVYPSIFDGIFRMIEATCLGAGLLLLVDIRRRVSGASKMKGEVKWTS